MISILAARPTEIGEVGWVGRWSPGIGDPTVMGWVTVAAYFAAAWLCFRVSRLLRNRSGKLLSRELLLWRMLVLILVALGINKQLDLQSAMTEGLRILSRQQGWYGDRRVYQSAFIQALALCTGVAGLALIAYTWRLSRGIKVAGVGLCLLGAFVLIRASSFHNMDELIRGQVMTLRMNWILELGGIGVVALGAHMARKRR